MKTADLTGAALDWAVGIADGVEMDEKHHGVWYDSPAWDAHRVEYTPSTDWSQGGPIIDREQLNLEPPGVFGWSCRDKRNAALSFSGPTPLIAAMRCYVASKLGDEVDIPKELT